VTALGAVLKSVIVVEVDDATAPTSVLNAVDVPEAITLARVPSNAVANTMVALSPAVV
jgi:hypothetical protein